MSEPNTSVTSPKSATCTEDRPLRIGLVVGEPSGAALAFGMLKELLKQHPNCVVEGIGCEKMQALGMRSLFDMNELSVMGLVEVLKHLPRLLKIRNSLVEHFIENPPDVYIGVDAPDFNLRVAKKLKAVGIPTVHYVSPTIWAWRENRIHNIAKATNLVLGIFPFEQQIYDKYKVPFTFVGHSLADEIPIEVDKSEAFTALELNQKDFAQGLLAILPGSRMREVQSLLYIFLETLLVLKSQKPELKAIVPAVNDKIYAEIKAQIHTFEQEKNVDLSDSLLVTKAPARKVMIASDAVLLASGTASLEAMLCKRPMVVAYKMSSITIAIMRFLYKPKYFSLPNILSNKQLVPEFLQDQVNAENLAENLLSVAFNGENNLDMLDEFTQIHQLLRCDASERAANAVLDLIAQTRDNKA